MPLFSIIIPTYNPNKYLPILLNSINMNNCLNEIEVIIVDDLSTESFDEIIKQYNKITIRKYSNEQHAGYPRDGRQKGRELASGKWICFADQDDYYIEHAFDKVKEYIENNNVHNYISTPFLEIYQNGEMIIRKPTKGWTHGKFYEKEFLDHYNINYDNINYNEDINLSTKIGCIITINDISSSVMEDPVYVWARQTDSLSDKKYFINALSDYIKATLKVIIYYLQQSKDNQDKFDILTYQFISTLLNIYFYMQSTCFITNTQQLIDGVNTLRPIYNKFKEITNLTTDKLINAIYGDYAWIYNEARSNCLEQNIFIERITFADWISQILDKS